MFINWNVTARFDPSSLADSTQGVSTHGIPIPSYCNTAVQTILLELRVGLLPKVRTRPQRLWTPSILCFGNMILFISMSKMALYLQRIFLMQLRKQTRLLWRACTRSRRQIWILKHFCMMLSAR